MSASSFYQALTKGPLRYLGIYAFAWLSVLGFSEKASLAADANPIQMAIHTYFGGLPGYQPGDLISQKDFDQVLKLLKSTGTPSERFAPLRAEIPPPSSYLQRTNGAKRGKKFLRKVASIPGGYASVENLASRPDGEKTLNQLEKDRGGYKMIQYIATTPGGKEMMRLTPGGRSPQKPAPRRIYTAADLAQAMQRLALSSAN